jgi:ethanolamine ammonia-lyase large subunit
MNLLELRQTCILAGEFKEGDRSVGGTSDAGVRHDARRALAAVRIGEIVPAAFVDDGVSEALERSLDARSHDVVSALTVGEVKHILLSPGGPDWVRRYRDGLCSEAIAALAKVMTTSSSTVARVIFNPLPGEGTTVGCRGHLARASQPNSPGDDDDDILLSMLEGLTYGCGDVIIGLNPASDDVETIVHPRICSGACRSAAVADAVLRCRTLSSRHGPGRADQSMSGSRVWRARRRRSTAWSASTSKDPRSRAGFDGCHFETGQGSAVTNGAAEGVDMVTLEARAHGVARTSRVGPARGRSSTTCCHFIGPEVPTASQLQRACLEDAVMAKLHGLTMGLDVCATFHMGIEPAALRETTRRIVELAAPAYLMAVAGNADPMLGYLTTSFREHPQLRRLSGRRLATAMRNRLVALGALTPEGEVPDVSRGTQAAASLYAAYAKEGGDWRTSDALRVEAVKIERCGYAAAPADTTPATRRCHRAARGDANYLQHSAYVLDAGWCVPVSPHSLHVRTTSRDGRTFAHPQPASAPQEDAALIAALRSSTARVRRRQVMSDGPRHR